MEEPFYRNGLRFSCQRCGRCCRIPDGIVYLTENDVQIAAEHLKISRDEFLRRYTHREHKHRVLNEFSNGDCIFFREGRGCIIYDARPEQCRTFPFWKQNLRSKEAWESVSEECSGIGKGEFYSFERIFKIVAGEGEAT